jgi:hypothetical protein
MMIATMMTIKTKVTAAVAAAWWQGRGGSGGNTALVVVAAQWWQRQCRGSNSTSLARTMVMIARRTTMTAKTVTSHLEIE